MTAHLTAKEADVIIANAMHAVPNISLSSMKADIDNRINSHFNQSQPITQQDYVRAGENMSTASHYIDRFLASLVMRIGASTDPNWRMEEVESGGCAVDNMTRRLSPFIKKAPKPKTTKKKLSGLN